METTKTLFQQQTDSLRIYLRRGDVRNICATHGVSMTSIYNAWRRSSFEEMTPTERVAYKAFVDKCIANRDDDKMFLAQLNKIAAV